MTRGLYRPEFEKDACGIGFIAKMNNEASHDVVADALTMLHRMEHRGGVAADDMTGDGAGITTKIPDQLFRNEAKSQNIDLPNPGNYGVAMAFIPKNLISLYDAIISDALDELNLDSFWVRSVKTNSHELGEFAKSNEPEIIQYFIKGDDLTGTALNRKLYIFRKLAEYKAKGQQQSDAFYFTSCSSDTIIYKGELRTWQLDDYYSDLQQESYGSSMAIVHSRFSTNTLPEWRLAQPFRFIAHNGEINTIKGNIIKMLSREALFKSTHFTKDEIDILLPICQLEFSDSANLDMAVELLVMGGRSLERVLAMLVPPAWKENEALTKELKAFYAYYATFLEPWDGPAALCFTDGHVIGACIDRNGLRPTRYAITQSGKIVFASETGIVDLEPADVIKRGKLKPGQMLLIDLDKGTFEEDEEIKSRLSLEYPYEEWNKNLLLPIDEICPPEKVFKAKTDHLLNDQLLFGYSREVLKFILEPMATKGTEPIGSMGNDTPLAVFAKRNAHISNYFKQLFAQVSNPAIDPIREKSVMSLVTYLGQSNNLLEDNDPTSRKIVLEHPVLTEAQCSFLKKYNAVNFKGTELSAVYRVADESLEEALERLTFSAEELVNAGANLLVISNKPVAGKLSIPALLITGAVHHHLLDKGLRARTSLIVEAGDVLETHHFATLIGYGASAVCPYLAFQSIVANDALDKAEAIEHYIKGVNYGLRKILSKMGISTLQSYESAQIFEILGLADEVVSRCFKGSVNRISGKGFKELEQEIIENHRLARDSYEIDRRLADGGIYQWRKEGEAHLFNPKTIHLLQKSTKLNDQALFRAYSKAIDQQEEANVTLRSLFDFNKTESIPLEEVESSEKIMKRFATGAMSFGSISEEAHTTIAKAMNLIGGKSNSGEGGEDANRLKPDKDRLLARSAIKQVASGRFGVTAHYLVNADEIQIKVAQGAKPGEGGQLPGLKVDENIARIRNSTPGVTLISPPPHHDIYSIEDLAQLIFDLKNVNPEAEINVKLVSEAGVGTIAAGVAKANADNILISGHDGGTGASPLGSIQHAGIPWEIGLAETHQTLMRNGLRNRIKLQTDGQIKTARDIAIATILGAEEWGVATAVLVVEGCIMMRKCHLNTCPVGIATQNQKLRKLFIGKVEHIVNFFTLMAEELRLIMANLGVKTINELVGRTDLLTYNKDKAQGNVGGLDLSPILDNPFIDETKVQYKNESQPSRIDQVLDHRLIQLAQPTFKHAERVRFEQSIISEDRTTGTMLSGKFAQQFGAEGLADGTITVDFSGTAGQSFGAFLSHGITFNLEGEANDYVGKGLSGGKLVIYPSPESSCKAAENILIGNVALYGATRGRLYINGQAGERFAVRNSGAKTVVEGVGDHGCEYMTGGRVVILGETGKNFAAGMSGGIAYVFAQDFDFHSRCNMELVELEFPNDDDYNFLLQMIEKHHRYTNSVKAIEILSQWEHAKQHFVKVIPTEYKKVLDLRNNFRQVIA
ncbi:glutamate synthase large subunit [Roseivirga misakiensis]|uniref:Glutamate synthase [NADPH] large chain n=1 Tax=Roseivirga misakiensis TaxID=1563681 RepID=A0A1E5T021_9BACT|nr:glutamate synthase large subunit [Roseivirga misakiensis]OEK04723.1 glutamate synthase subunit alpha [Roseivirga misakiensis]